MKDKRVSLIYGEEGLFTFELCQRKEHWYNYNEGNNVETTYFIGRFGLNKEATLTYCMTNNDWGFKGTLSFK